MMKRNVWVVMLALAGCVATGPWPHHPQLDDWVAFRNRVDGLDGAALLTEYEAASEQLREQPGDSVRLHLSYLLSRPNLPMRDMSKSQALLAEISPDSVYAPFRDLLAREFVLQIELETARKEVQELRAQLEALKGIDADLSEGQAEIEELSK